MLSGERARVENAIAAVKHYRRVSSVYEGTLEGFNAEFNVACELANARLMFRNGTYGHWQSVLGGWKGASGPPAAACRWRRQPHAKTSRKSRPHMDLFRGRSCRNRARFPDSSSVFPIVPAPQPVRRPRCTRRHATNSAKPRELPPRMFIMHVCANFFFKYNNNKPDTASSESIFVGDESGAIYEHIFGPVTQEDLDIESESRNEFECLLVEGLRMCRIEFATVQPKSGTMTIAKNMYAEGRYKNDKGVSLSPIDCHLLNLVSTNPNVDLLTDDKTLIKAVAAECGKRRVTEVFNDYFGRLNMTAHLLSRLLNVDFVDCKPIRDRIEYYHKYASTNKPNFLLSHKSKTSSILDQDPHMIVAIQCSPDGLWAESGTLLRNMKRSIVSDIMGTLLNFVDLVMLDWYCACEDPNWIKFDHKWVEVKYDFDTMKIKSKNKKPHYEIAKNILKRNRERYCACTISDKRALHKIFKTIAATGDQEIRDRILSRHQL